MAITHCGAWDSSINLLKPSALVPASSVEIDYDTSNKKWGAGSLRHVYAGANGEIYWDSLTGLPSSVGTIGMWVYRGTGTNRDQYIYLVKPSSNNNRLIFRVILTAGGDRTLVVQMYDNGGTLRVNVTSTTVPVTVGWHYAALAWDWSGSPAVTEAYFDTSRLINDTSGTYTRDTDTSRLRIVMGAIADPNYDDGHIDDLTIYNTKLYTGATITVPTSLECGEVAGVLRFGYPFGLGFANQFGL